MSENKRYYWIKLKESFMTSDAVDFLMSQPDGANYVVLYQMLCLKTINTGGRLERHIGEVIIPYDEAKIQRDTKYFTIDTVRVALTLYKSLGLIYVDNDGALCLTDHENLVGSETNWKEIKQKQRAKKLPVLTAGKRLNSNTLLLPTGEKQTVDEKRYGGNGMKAFDLAGYCCEMCGSNTGLVIHHANEYSNDIEDLYILCTTCHGIVHSEGTPSDWLHHSRGGQWGGQEGGQVHLNVHPDIDIRDRDKEIEKDKETESRTKGGVGENEGADAPAPTQAPKKQVQRHQYGEFGWVKLTDAEYQKLVADMGEAEFKRCLQYVDEAAEKTHNKNGWKNWNLVMRACHRDGWGLGHYEPKGSGGGKPFKYDYGNDADTLPF